jgi:hypothetical protein
MATLGLGDSQAQDKVVVAVAAVVVVAVVLTEE